MQILVSGASFAGLATAYWMRQLGHTPTIVETAHELKRGGTAVDIRGNTVDVVRRMGILDAIRERRMGLRRWDMKNADDVTERSLVMREEGQPIPDDGFEIPRDVLLQLLFDLVKDDVETIFGDRITALDESAESIDVTFAKHPPRAFDLVLGCDGVHSGVRGIAFGPESDYTHFLEQYFSISIVDELLIERDTAQMFNVPGKAIMLNAYANKTDVIFGFFAEARLAYDRRDEAQQRRIIADAFAGVGWRAGELLAKIATAESFYFDALAQIRMPSWSKGRVALVGDAGYCPSPAAGMGGSLALDGAAAFADAMRAHGSDHASAFRAYERALRPFVEEVQAEAVRTGLETLVPRTEEAIRARNAKTDDAF